MATYRQIQGNLSTMNEAQRNEAAIAAGYTGYSDYLDNANKPAQNNPSMTNAQISGQGGAGPGLNMGSMFGGGQSTIDLPSMYKNLYASSGISAKEAEYTQKERQYIEARNKISDNPFLDASTVDKRLSRLKGKFEEEVNPLRTEIAMKKADIDTQLGLQTKQFDINNTVTQQNIAQFNSLLQSGALNNASPDDLAMITRSTGISSSMIQGAVESMKAKNLQTTVQTYDDGTNQGYKIITIDPYGNIVNSKTEILGPSSKQSTGAGVFNFGGYGAGSSDSEWEVVTPASKNISEGWDAISTNNGVSGAGSYVGTNWTDPRSGTNYTYTNNGFA